MADRPDHLYLTVFVLAVGGLAGIVVNGASLLGASVLGPGLWSWPGLHVPLTILGFVASALGLVAVSGLLWGRPWATTLGGVLGLTAVLVSLLALLVLAPLKGFVYPTGDVLLWVVVSLAGIWIVVFCTDPDVRSHYADREVFPSTREASESSSSAE